MTITDGLVIGGRPGQVGGVFSQVGVPDVIGKARADAEADLASLGLGSRVVDVEALGTVGTVYDQNPRPPATRSRGFVVTLQVIKAPPTPTPDIVKKLTSLTTKIDTDLTALAAVTNTLESDAAAQTRQDQLAALTTQIGTALAELAAVANTLETDTAADSRQDEILTKLEDIATQLTEEKRASASRRKTGSKTA
jgi:hypothetical protein